MPGKLLRRERSLRLCHRPPPPPLPKKNICQRFPCNTAVREFNFWENWVQIHRRPRSPTHTRTQTTIPFCCARNSWEELIGISLVARHDDNFLTCFARGSRRVLVAFFLWDLQDGAKSSISFFFCRFYFYMVGDELSIMNKSPRQSNNVGGCVSLLLTFEFL